MPKVVDRTAMQQDLARRSVEVFAREGYASLSMRRLAEALGVSTGTLYHYFPTKAALFEATVACVSEQDIAEGTRLLAQVAPEPAERLEPLLSFLAANMDRLVGQYRVLIEFASLSDAADPKWRETVVSARKRYIDALAWVLAIDDRHALDIVLLAINGMILRALAGDRSTDPSRVAASLASMLFPKETTR